jgi:hypothetical protein
VDPAIDMHNVHPIVFEKNDKQSKFVGIIHAYDTCNWNRSDAKINI